MRIQATHIVLIALISVASIVAPAHAGWSPLGNRLHGLPDSSIPSYVVADDAGGAIVVYFGQLFQSSGQDDIHAQRFDAYGNRLWGNAGSGIATLPGTTHYVEAAIPDGFGGVIVSFRDNRFGDYTVFAQRLSANGIPLWNPNGVRLVVAARSQAASALVPDGNGGAIVAWYDLRSSSDYDIYAQHLNSAGVKLWATSGVLIAAGANHQYVPRMTTDGAGGAIVAWWDAASGDHDLYSTRLYSNGTKSFPNGTPLIVAAGDQFAHAITTDGAGGAFVVWQDERISPAEADIYASHLGTDGARTWLSTGLPVCTQPGVQEFPAVAYDDNGGCVVAWTDRRSGFSDVYAQRLTDLGGFVWSGAAGTPVDTTSGIQKDIGVASDGKGGAYFVYDDRFDVSAQYIRSDGLALWGPDGVAVAHSEESESQFSATIYADPAGGVYVPWRQLYGAPDGDYAAFLQRLDSNHGEFGHPEPAMSSVADNPGDQGGTAIVNWIASDRDNLGDALITHYSVWRATDALPAAMATANPEAVSTPSRVGPAFIGSAFYREQTAAGPLFWEWVGNQSATYSPGYSYAAATRQDSVGGNTNLHHFRVIAHTLDTQVFFESNPDSGYSVDNLAPGAPMMLAAQRAGNDVLLDWSPSAQADPDLKEYAVYRGTAAGVTPDPILFLTASVDTMTTDSGAPTSVLYYIVTAMDVHGNESGTSNEASVNATATGIGDRAPALTTLQLRTNMPNPFSTSTQLRIGLPTEAPVRVDVFDVAGRRVAARNLGTMNAGWQSVRFDGRDRNGRRLPSGVYFYRVQAGDFRDTGRMVISR